MHLSVTKFRETATDSNKLLNSSPLDVEMWEWAIFPNSYSHVSKAIKEKVQKLRVNKKILERIPCSRFVKTCATELSCKITRLCKAVSLQMYLVLSY